MHWKILTFIMEEDKNKIRNQHVLLIFRHPSHENIPYIANIWPLKTVHVKTVHNQHMIVARSTKHSY